MHFHIEESKSNFEQSSNPLSSHHQNRSGFTTDFPISLEKSAFSFSLHLSTSKAAKIQWFTNITQIFLNPQVIVEHFCCIYHNI